tara:strand:- start:1244 stop:3253 length:2010 start_codon:yes stop_codon:yes gene_type:complete
MYKQKYLKYKQKYLDLKRGGGTDSMKRGYFKEIIYDNIINRIRTKEREIPKEDEGCIIDNPNIKVNRSNCPIDIYKNSCYNINENKCIGGIYKDNGFFNELIINPNLINLLSIEKKREYELKLREYLSKFSTIELEKLIIENPNYYNYIPKEKKKDKDFLKKIIVVYNYLFNYLDQDIKDDVIFIKELFKDNSYIIYYLDDKYKNLEFFISILQNEDIRKKSTIVDKQGLYIYITKYDMLNTKDDLNKFLMNIILSNTYNYYEFKNYVIKKFGGLYNIKDERNGIIDQINLNKISIDNFNLLENFNESNNIDIVEKERHLLKKLYNLNYILIDTKFRFNRHNIYKLTYNKPKYTVLNNKIFQTLNNNDYILSAHGNLIPDRLVKIPNNITVIALESFGQIVYDELKIKEQQLNIDNNFLRSNWKIYSSNQYIPEQNINFKLIWDNKIDGSLSGLLDINKMKELIKNINNEEEFNTIFDTYTNLPECKENMKNIFLNYGQIRMNDLNDNIECLQYFSEVEILTEVNDYSTKLSTILEILSKYKSNITLYVSACRECDSTILKSLKHECFNLLDKTFMNEISFNERDEIIDTVELTKQDSFSGLRVTTENIENFSSTILKQIADSFESNDSVDKIRIEEIIEKPIINYIDLCRLLEILKKKNIFIKNDIYK